MIDPEKLGTMANVRTSAYQAHMRNTIQKGVCPLCDLDPKLNVVIQRNQHWRIWKNPFGYAHHKHHFVIASVEHIDDVTKLTPEMWSDLGEIVNWVVTTFNLPGGGLVMRFGDPEHSASTLRHLHMQIQVPDKTGYAIAVFRKSAMLNAFLWLDRTLKRWFGT